MNIEARGTKKRYIQFDDIQNSPNLKTLMNA